MLPYLNFELLDNQEKYHNIPRQDIYKVLMAREEPNKRVANWLNILDKYDIKLIVSEGFPFCRHQFAYELTQMFSEAHKRGIKIVVSVRDFPWDEPHQKSLQDWVAITQNLIIDKYVSGIMVHGDPKVVPWLSDRIVHCNPNQLRQEIEDKLYFTGYVCNPSQLKHIRKNNKIYISCGLNKDEGVVIFNKILKSAYMFPEYEFIITLANKVVSSKYGIKEKKKDNVTLVDYIPDLHKKISECALFITYGGYNSTMEILKGGIPAIVIPRSDGEKQEQFVRSHIMKEHEVFKVCNMSDLNNLHIVIKECLIDPQFPNKCNFDLNGAEKSAKYLINMAS